MTEQLTPAIKRTPLVELYLTIRSWVLFLLSKWWVLLLCAVVGGALGYWYAVRSKPVYQSRLTFALDEGGSGSMNGAMSLAAQFGLNIGGNSSDVFGGDNILEIMKSRRNFETVMLSVDSSEAKPITLMDEFLRINQWQKSTADNERLRKVSYPAGIKKNQLTYLQDSILFETYDKFIKFSLSAVRPDKRLNVFEVSVVSPDEKFSKIFTDRLVSNTSAFYMEIRTKKSRSTLEVLESRAAATKGMLNNSISSRAAAQDANVNPAFAEAQAPLQKQQFNIQVYGGAYGELYKNLELARFQYLKDIPLLQVIDAADYPMKKIKFGKLRGMVIGGFIAGLLGIFIVGFVQFIKTIET